MHIFCDVFTPEQQRVQPPATEQQLHPRAVLHAKIVFLLMCRAARGVVNQNALVDILNRDYNQLLNSGVPSATSFFQGN